MYEQRIDIARRAAAIAFGLSGLGIVVCSRMRLGVCAWIFVYLTAASLFAVFCLFVEYLVRSWMETRKSGVARFQFTLYELLLLTAVAAVPLGIYRILGGATIPIMVLSVVVVATGLEMVRSARRRGESQPASTDSKESSRWI